jgi:hypothetical protein
MCLFKHSTSVWRRWNDRGDRRRMSERMWLGEVLFGYCKHATHFEKTLYSAFAFATYVGLI